MKSTVLHLGLMASFPTLVDFQSGLESSGYLVPLKACQQGEAEGKAVSLPGGFLSHGALGCIRGLRCEALGQRGSV